MTPIPEIDCTKPVKLLDRPERLPEQYHLFDDDSAQAIRAALAAMRPLLVRGEPGMGKTQLAAAAASVFGRPLVTKVVDSRTESRDLMWEFDAVLRLADAQIAAALHAAKVGQNNTGEGENEARDDSRGGLRKQLRIANYLRPGPLWWAFNWESARRQARRTRTPIPSLRANADPQKGCVVLLDEIDKADTDVPNGLLEALGSGDFTPLGQSDPVEATGEPPLVVITTNEERVLPNAFVRRCLVLELKLPEDDALIAHLVALRGGSFPQASDDRAGRLRRRGRIARQGSPHRPESERHAASRPGRIPRPLAGRVPTVPEDVELQKKRLEAVARFAIRKYEQVVP